MSLESTVAASTANLDTTDLQTLARGVHSEMLAVNELMARAKEQNLLPAGTLEAWRAVRDQWASWYAKAGGGTWDADNGETRWVVRTYGEQLVEWRKNLARWAPSVVAADQGAGGMSWLFAVGALAAGYVFLRQRR